MLRRLATFLVVAVLTAVGTLYWLHDGDLKQAVEPVAARWDTELLLQEAGLHTLDAPMAAESSAD